jgi:hypothetical protein
VIIVAGQFLSVGWWKDHKLHGNQIIFNEKGTKYETQWVEGRPKQRKISFCDGSVKNMKWDDAGVPIQFF